MEHKAITIFRTEQDARRYRHEHGTGGWIFSPQDKDEDVLLFPPCYAPIQIFHHPMTAGRTGMLIGSQ